MGKPTNYYAVIFTSIRTDGDKGYAAMAVEMEKLARRQPGFIGMESARDQVGITVSYWETLEDIARWKSQADHLVAQQKGRSDWYRWYRVRICSVERDYEFNRP